VQSGQAPTEGIWEVPLQAALLNALVLGQCPGRGVMWVQIS